MKITRKHGISTIENILNIRVELSKKGKYRYQNWYKVFIFDKTSNAYIYDRYDTRDSLIFKANGKLNALRSIDEYESYTIEDALDDIKIYDKKHNIIKG